MDDVARDYVAALALFTKAQARLIEARSALNAAIAERRRNGERGKDIAADLGMKPQFVNQSARNAEQVSTAHANHPAARGPRSAIAEHHSSGPYSPGRG